MSDPKITEQKPDEKPETDDGNAGGGASPSKPPEMGGRGGLDPTRYGDWEIGGRCIDF